MGLVALTKNQGVKISNRKMGLKNTLLKLFAYLPGPSELIPVCIINLKLGQD